MRIIRPDLGQLDLTAVLQAYDAAPDGAAPGYIPPSQWRHATRLNTPKPWGSTAVADLYMAALLNVWIVGLLDGTVAVLLAILTASGLACGLARTWVYRYRVWPRMYRLAHPHRLEPVGTVRKTWVPGQARCHAYLDGRLP